MTRQMYRVTATLTVGRCYTTCTLGIEAAIRAAKRYWREGATVVDVSAMPNR